MKSLIESNSDVIIMSVTIMDLITAFLVMVNPHPLLVARMGIFYEIFQDKYVGSVLMIVAAFMALFGMVYRSHIKRFLLMLPQQIFLLMTTGSAVDFITMQHYADGVTRPWQFILQDQLPTIILTIAYFFAILDFRKKVV